MPADATIRNYLASRPRAPLCSRCGEIEPRCGRGAVAVVCAACTALLASRPRTKTEGRKCPECGGALPYRKRLCAACAKAKRRAAERASRAKRATQQLRENRAYKPLSDKG